MPIRTRPDPYTSYNFEVVINGVSGDGRAVKGSFSEVSGLESSQDPIEYRNGSEPPTKRKMPGLVKHSDVTFKRGVTGDTDFWRWILEGLSGKIRRTSGAIILNDENGEEYMRWTFDRAWPTKFTGPTLNAGNNEIAMETLVVCCEKLEIDLS